MMLYYFDQVDLKKNLTAKFIFNRSDKKDND